MNDENIPKHKFVTVPLYLRSLLLDRQHYFLFNQLVAPIDAQLFLQIQQNSTVKFFLKCINVGPEYMHFPLDCVLPKLA